MNEQKNLKNNNICVHNNKRASPIILQWLGLAYLTTLILVAHHTDRGSSHNFHVFTQLHFSAFSLNHTFFFVFFNHPLCPSKCHKHLQSQSHEDFLTRIIESRVQVQNKSSKAQCREGKVMMIC